MTLEETKTYVLNEALTARTGRGDYLLSEHQLLLLLELAYKAGDLAGMEETHARTMKIIDDVIAPVK